MKYKTAKKFIHIFAAGFPTGSKTVTDAVADFKTKFKGVLTGIAGTAFKFEGGAVYRIDAGGVGVKIRFGQDGDGIVVVGFNNDSSPLTVDKWAAVARPLVDNDGEVTIERV